MFLLYIIIPFLVKYLEAGFVLPDQANPIVPYRNNELAWGEYVFFVSFSTRIVSDVQIEIVYPQEFDPSQIVLKRSPLMSYDDPCAILMEYSTTSFCPSYAPMGDQNSIPIVVLADRTVRIQLPPGQVLNAGSYKITIKYNQNPKGYGGLSTGDFKIRTYYQSVLVDQNENFGSVGFAPQYTSHIYKNLEGILQNDGSNLGGYVTNYIVLFTTTVDLALNSWFRFEFADGFDLSGLVCYLKDTNQNLGCKTIGNRVFFSSINVELGVGTHSIQLRTVKNPYSTGLTGAFVFETLLPYVNTVVDYYLLNPVSILPGQIINPSVAANPLNKNLRVDYTCKFTPQNQIPVNGMIVYTFPPGYQLDPICRIIYGLAPATVGGQVTCVSSGLTITITNFAQFNSQEIQFNIFATNPSVSQIYQPFTIKSYSTFGASLKAFKQIDQNLDAGQIQISEIESPYYVAIDLYRKMKNLSLDATGPIDFRLYPNAGHELALTASGAMGEISLQMFKFYYIISPLWWRLQLQSFDATNINGATPTCMFGAEPSQQCSYVLQMFKLNTPSSTNYPKFPTNMGLGQCDLPISLANVRLTPIPGRWDFRTITMIGDTYTNFKTTPEEQDLYTMDIPPDQFPAPTSVICTSKDQVDYETVCYASITIGLPVPYEGVINFNMSTLNDTYQTVSAWPQDLGFSLLANGKTAIPCTVVINGQTVGYVGTLHPNVKCFAFAGGPARPYAILQVRGFSSLIATGTTMFIVIPDITSCTAYNLNCFITLTSAYTAELDQPYTLNYLVTSVALVVKGSISTEVSQAGGVGPPITLADPTLKADFNNLIEICTRTTWTFTFTNPATAISPATTTKQSDNILVKIPRARFVNNGIPIFSLTGATSSNGLVYVIDNYRANINMIYFFIIITNQIPNTSPNTFTIGNIVNPVDFSPGIVTQMVYWVNQRRISRIVFPISKPWLNGGILNPFFQILPKPAYNPANRQESVDMDFNSQIVFMASFQTCHQVPLGGMVEVSIQNGLVSSLPTCLVWSGVTSPAIGLGFTHQCSRVEVPIGSGKFFYQITGFSAIPPMTKITISFRGTTGLVAAIAPPITINTYFSAAIRISTPASASNQNDYYRLVLPGIDVKGPKIFPNKLQWMPFQIIDTLARQNKRAEFYMFVKYSFSIPTYTVNAVPRLLFTFNSSAIGMSSTPYCRLDGHLCPICSWNGGVLSMSMPLLYGMTANQNSLVMLSSRGADGSSSTREGFDQYLAGRFQLKAETSNTGNTKEFTYLVMDIQPQKFWYYWVWASSKIGVDPINSDPQVNLAMYRIFFTNPIYIPPANNPDPVTITLQFFRVLPPTFTNGYEQDIGTGHPHRYDLPCIHVGFNLLPTKTKPKCRLFIGSYPNPTQIIITDFAGIPAWSNCEIHIPQIFNPNSTLQLVSVGLKADLVLAASGATIPLLQNTYSYINNTFGREAWNTPSSPALPQISVDVRVLNKLQLQTAYPAAANPFFTQTTIDTMDNFQLQFVSKDQQLGGGADCIIFNLPSLWNLPYGAIPCNFALGGVTCISYPDAHQVALYLTSTVPKATLVTGTIAIKTPPFKILVSASDPPIQVYVYTRSKLVDIYSVQFTQVMVAVPVVVKVSVDIPSFSQLAQYTVIIANVKNIPLGGAIQITFPTQLVARQYGCTNDLIGGSQLSQVGFQCQITGQNLLITGFNLFVGPGNIRIQIRMQNPAVQVTGTWSYNSYYLNESPLNKLITYCANVVSPTLSIPTQIFYWDTPYLSRQRQVELGLGSIELRVVLTQSSLAAGSSLIITLPFSTVGCYQYLCLWDPTPWFDNHNDNWLSAQSCIYNSATSQLTVQTPIGVTIPVLTLYRLIIDTQNSVDGNRGFTLPAYGYQTFTVQTANEMVYAKAFIPKKSKFLFFECYSLVTNVNFKNMFSIKFQPNTAVPVGGSLIMYVPTANEYGYPLFDDDLASGIPNLGAINCYARSGFAVTVVLSCTLTHGMQLLGAPVLITIKGNWLTSLTSTYVVEVDQFWNPKIAGDANHIEMRLESYNGATLLDMSLSYDMSLKLFTYVTSTLPMPSTSTNVVLDASVTYDLQISTSVPLTNAWLYDWYVIEFTKPTYIAEPYGIQCKSGSSVPCTVTQGHNWVIMDIKDIAASSTQGYTLTNVNNPVILPVAGVVLKGYAIRDRIVMSVYTYAPITTFVTAVGGATTSMFVITPMDYLATQIPFSTIVRYRVQILVSSKSPGTILGSVVDLIFPTGFLAYPNCINDVTGGSLMTTTTQDYLTCTTNPAVLAKFAGRQSLSFTGFDAMPALASMTIILYAKTPPTAVVAPQWDFKCYQATDRLIQLFDGLVPGPDVQNYPSFTDFTWKPMSPQTIRSGSSQPLIFTLIFPTAVLNTDTLLINLPSSALISIPTGAVLHCVISTPTNRYTSSVCIPSLTGATITTVSMQFPLEPLTLAAGVVYTIEINTIGADLVRGLLYGASGKFQAGLTIGATTGSLFFEVLPTASFVSANIKVINAIQNQLTGFIVSFKTTVKIPVNGKIIVGFPTKSLDGSVRYFQDDLTGSVQQGGGMYSCSATMSLLFTQAFDCRIYKNKGIMPRTEIAIQNFPAAINAGTTISFVIEQIQILYSANTATIPLELYTIDSNMNKLESIIFYDWVSPIAPTAGFGAAMTVTFTLPSSNLIQATNQLYKFSNINVGAGQITSSSMIVFQFPKGQHDLSTVGLSATTSPNCFANGVVQAIANYVIYTQTVTPPTPCTGSGLIFVLSNIVNPISTAPLQYVVSVCLDRACVYTGTNAATNFKGTPSLSAIHTAISDQVTFPRSCVMLSATLPMNVNLPIGAQIIVWYPDTTFYVDRIEAFQGIGSFSIQRTLQSGQQWFTLTLNTNYVPTNGNIGINVYGQLQSSLAAAGTIYKLGIYTRFQALAVNLDTLNPYFSKPPTAGFVAINQNALAQGQIKSVNVIPGIVGVDSTIYLTLPTLTVLVPATVGLLTYKYAITINGVSLSASSGANCTVSWVMTIIPATPIPQCYVTAAGIIVIDNIPYEGTLDPMAIEIQSFNFATAGQLTVSVQVYSQVVLSSVLVQLGVYYGYTIIHPKQVGALNANFQFLTNNLMSDNIMTINFQLPGSIILASGTLGAFYLDILSPVNIPLNYQRKILCQVGTNPGAQCTWLPMARLSSNSTTSSTMYDGFANVLNTRILIQKFADITTSATVQILIYFDQSFTTTVNDHIQKYFQFGYYSLTGFGNQMNYQFGQNFMQVVSTAIISPGTASLALSGTVQGTKTMSFTVTCSGSDTIKQDDQIYIKFKDGYHMAMNSNNYLKPGLAQPTTITITGGGSCDPFNQNLAFIVCTSSGAPLTSVTITIIAMEQPFLPSGITKIASIYAVDCQTATPTLVVYASVDYSVTGTLTPGVLISTLATQFNSTLFYFEFQLPTGFQAFNNYDCAPGTCMQSLQVVSSSFNDFDSFDVQSGIGSAITLQQNPTVNSQMVQSFTGGSLSINGFSLVTSSAKICLWVRTVTVPTAGASKQFTFNIIHNAIITATANVNIAVSAGIPTGQLIGFIPSQFGYMDYQEQNANFAKSSYGYLVFRFTLGFTPTIGGKFKLKTSTLNLAAYAITNNRPRCFFRMSSSRYFSPYAAIGCSVDSTNLWILVPYNPAVAFVSTTQYELVIFNEQAIQPLFQMPITRGFNPVTVTYETAGGVIQAISMLNLNTYEKQSTKVNYRNFVGHSGSSTLFQLSYTVSYATPSTASIYLQFPLADLIGTSLTPYFPIDLGTGLQHGFKINCLDRIGNLGATYTCQLFQGITSYQLISSYIQISGINALSLGSQVSINIMNFKVPSLVNSVYPIQLRVADNIGNYYEYYPIYDAIYVLSAYAGTATAQSKASITPLTTNQVSNLQYKLATTTSQSTSQYATVLFKYNVDLWGQSYSGYQAKVAGMVAQIDPLDQTSAFITLPANQASGVTIAINIIAGLMNPLYSGPFTSVCSLTWINYLEGQITRFVTDTISTTLTPGSPYATSSALSQSSYFQGDPNTIIYMPFLLNMKVLKNTAIQVTFPVGFAVTSGAYCQLITGTYKYKMSTVYDTVNRMFSITILETIPAATNVVLWAQVTLPTTVATYTVAFSFYKSNAFLQLYQASTLSSITLVNYYRMYNSGVSPIKTPQVLLQAKEIGPITLTFVPTVAMINNLDYIVITNSFIGAIFDYPVQQFYEVRCFWNDMAAMMCFQNLAAKTITVYRPSSTVISIGTQYTIFVTLWRLQPFGVIDFSYLWLPTAQVLTPTLITKVPLSSYLKDGTLKEKFSYNVPIQNYRFSILNALLQPTRNYIAIHQATINTNTLLTVHFTLQKPLLSALGTNWGRIILSIPTADDKYGQPQFPDGFGRFTQNAQQIDCYCNNCPAYAVFPAQLFICTVYMGYQNQNAPSQIWLDPQFNLAALDLIDITFPKIMLPPTINSQTKMSLLAFQYSSGTKIFTNISEIVYDFTFITHNDAYPVQTSQTAPTFTPDLVGGPANVNWVIKNPYAPILQKCHDRWVLETVDPAMIFENPFNPVNLMLYTTAVQHTVAIFTLAQWISFTPTVTQPQSLTTQTLSVINLKNMPYQIPAGVKFNIYLYINVGTRSEYDYKAKPTAAVHPIFFKALNPIPLPPLVLQPNEYQLVFESFNKIPMGGKIELDFPNYDWTFSDAYCLVTSGLVDCACNLISTTKQIEIQDCIQDYDPRLHGKINMQFNIINPSTAQTAIPFKWRSYWDKNQPWLIDQDTYFENTPTNTIIAGGILRVTLFDRYEHPITICGGKVGPISLLFNIAQGNLYYPNDYIVLDMWSAFQPAAGYQEIICTFNDPNDLIIVNIKSHRCDWAPGTNGGQLLIYIAEEVDILKNKDWLLVLTTRGSAQGDGWLVRNPSDSYWVTFSTSTTLDKGWFEAIIPGCPFNTWNFNCENVDWQASPAIGIPAYSIFNFTAQTQFNNIPAGDPTVPGYSRFLYEFLTHNELSKSFPTDITNRMGPTDGSIEMACNGLILQNTKPLQAQGKSYIQCLNIKAAGNAWNDTPSYVTAQYYEQIPVGQRFNLQLAEFINGQVVGSAAHIKINMQVQKMDGTFYSQNEHYCWNAPSGLYAVPTPSTTATATLSESNYNVNQNMGVSTFVVNLLPGDDINYGDVIVYKYSYPYIFPQRGYCQQPNTQALDWAETACTPQPFNLWFVIANNFYKNSAKPFIINEMYNFVNPPFIVEDGNPNSPLSVYVWRQHKLIYNLTLPRQSPKKLPAYVVLQTTQAENPHNQWVKYHVGLFMTTSTIQMTHIRLWAPNDFQNIQNCTVNRGLVLRDLNNINSPVTCTITQISAGGTNFPNDGWMLEIDNFAPYQGDGWMIFDMEIMNPLTARWTQNWRVGTFQSKANLTYRINDNNQSTGGQTWSGSQVRQPNLFRVWRNTESFEDRRAQTDEYAELDLRILPREEHPPTTTQSVTSLEIWMPLSFDIPNGGQTMCDFGQQYHEDLDAQQCAITSNRKITMNTDRFYGIKPNCTQTNCQNKTSTACQLVSATTVGATGGHDGVKLPSVPGVSQFQVFLSSTDAAGQSLREYQYLSGSAAPKQLTSGNLKIDSLIREVGRRTVVKVQFTVTLDIPAGYDSSQNTIDPLHKNPIGYIEIFFNTHDLVNNGWDGFPLDLGQSGPAYAVLCQGFQQLIPQVGQNLICTVKPSNSYDVNYPAVITISNFQYITSGQVVEVDLLNILNGQNSQNNGQVDVSAYEITGDGSSIQLIERTTGYIPLYNILTQQLLFTLSAVCPLFSDITITPQQVGAFTQITLNINFQNYYIVPVTIPITIPPPILFTAGDRITLQFPTAFGFPTPTQSSQLISSSWDGIQMITTVYPLIQTIVFEFPVGIVTQTNGAHVLKISQLVNAAYAFTAPYIIHYVLLRQDYRVVECDILNVPAPQVATPISSAMSLSSTFSGDVYVSYNFGFTPSYFIPAGSTITIALPNRGSLNYNQIGNSVPAAQCLISDNTTMGPCVMSPTSLTIITTHDISPNSPLQISLTGAKNPNYVGQTLLSDFSLSIQHPNGFLINQQSFSPFTFFSPKNVGVIFMTMVASNLFKAVSSDYTFTLQSSTFVPPLGLVQLKLPIAWAQILPTPFYISQLSGSWTTDQLSYTATLDKTSDPLNYLLKIVNNFAWPSRNSLTIKIFKLLNPNLTTTQIFQAQTFYDSLALDQTDPSDQSLRFTYKSFVPGITVLSQSQSPSNAGEVSSYSFQLQSPTDIPSGGQIQLQFPSTFAPSLSTYDKSVSCVLTFSDGSSVTTACTAQNQKLTIPISTLLPKGKTFKLSIVGIANPNLDTSAGATPPQIDILTLNQQGQILQYTNNASQIQTTAAPKTMAFTSVASSSLDLQSKANYTFCVTTSSPIPVDAQVYIDFPQQFQLRQNTYTCTTGKAHDDTQLPYQNTKQSPRCAVTNSLRRIAISGQVAAYPGMPPATSPAQLCYVVQNVENPSQPGPSNNFQVSIFDQSSKQILYQTFGTLSSNITLTYQREGLQIVVAAIAPIAKLTSSPQISVTLERAVSYPVILTPYSSEFNLDPSVLVFLPQNGPTAYFRISPKNGSIPVGQKSILWTKVENVTSGQATKFSQVANSYFQYIAKPASQSLSLTIYPLVSRAALGATSLPITLTLSQPASIPLTVVYEVPNQQNITFSPEYVVFAPGQTTQTLTYTTQPGAKSGIIDFWINDTQFNDVYYMPQKTVNFEILQEDNNPPIVLQYYAMNIGRTMMYWRASIDKSVTLYYEVILRGSVLPTFSQIYYNKTKDTVWKQFGSNFSYIAPITVNYVYNDVYLMLNGLYEQTDYTLFFFVKDLSGNNNSQVITFNFTTLSKQLPAEFKIKLKGNVDPAKLLQAFGLATGLTPDRFVIVASPPVYSIPGADEKAVLDILSQQTTTYTIRILPSPTVEGLSPLQYVAQIDQNKDLIKKEIPELDTSFSIINNAFEVIQYPQEFKYTPSLMNVTEEQVFIKAQIRYTGHLYSVLLPIDALKPSSKQISMGLDSTNTKLKRNRRHKVKFQYELNTPSQTQVLTDVFSYGMLFDNSWYTAYFTADNNLPVNPDLLPDSEVQQITFRTHREVIIIPKKYVYGQIVGTVLLTLLVLVN